MEQKPKQIWMLIILCLIISVLFIISAVQVASYYSDTISIFENDILNMFEYLRNATVFHYVVHMLFLLIAIIGAFLIALGTFYMKKWTWIIGMIYSSVLVVFFSYNVMEFLGPAILRGDLDSIFANIVYVIFIILPFLGLSGIILLTRFPVKNYFKIS